MSLAETQELMRTMQELMALLNNVEAKTEKITSTMPATREALGNFRQLERVALRYLAISRRMGLPDKIGNATQIISQFIVMIRMAQMSYTMLISSTPYGWAMGAAGLAMTAFAASDFVMNPGS